MVDVPNPTPGVRIIQAAANPLVVLKHSRREDRAAAYERFVVSCLKHIRAGDQESISELRVALFAIEIRAPRHVRKAAYRFYRRIAGYPFESDSLDIPRRIPDSAYRMPPEEDPEYEEAKLYDTVIAQVTSEEAEEGILPRISGGQDFDEEMMKFSEVARIDVNNQWQWWHRPIALLPPLKRWWLAR